MTILFLGPPESPVRKFLERYENTPIAWSDRPLSESFVKKIGPDFLVSHGYRHIVRPAVLKMVPRAAINLHISYLPWNRGSEPNFWSFFENTPKGVTIHLMDEHIDTGEIIAQRAMMFQPLDTLSSSYEKLQAALMELFTQAWPLLRTGNFGTSRQVGSGSYHRLKDREALPDILHLGWKTLASEVTAYGRAWRESNSERGKPICPQPGLLRQV